ncbi:MAG: MFS transporter [Armatimonadetes bacterium]|nr:MFS transporter [Armatimonadota bacterium]
MKPHERAIHQSLNEAQVGRHHWKIWFLSSMGVFLDGFDLFIMAVALPLIDHHYHPDPASLGMVGASAMLGALIGASVLGRLTDAWGRKKLYVADLGLFILFSVLCATSDSIWALTLWRFMLGVGIGADYPISSSYVSEFMPSRVRGRMLVGSFSFQALGSLAGAACGLVILWIYPQDEAWRWMLAAGTVPALVVLIMRLPLPESPLWSLSHGRAEDARRIVSEVVDQVIEEPPVAVLLARESAAALESPVVAAALTEVERGLVVQPIRRSYLDLLREPLLRRTILAAVPWFFMDVGLYGVGFFTPTILAAMAFSGKGSFIAQDIAATEGDMIVDIFLVAGFLLAIWLVDRWGRIRLQLIGFAGMTVGLLMLAVAAVLPEDNLDLFLTFAGFALFNLMVNMGPNATTFLLPIELYPTALRGSGHGLAASFGKLGAAVGVFLLPVARDRLGLAPTLGLTACAVFIGFLVTWFFAVETRGVSLEETEMEGASNGAH